MIIDIQDMVIDPFLFKHFSIFSQMCPFIYQALSSFNFFFLFPHIDIQKLNEELTLQKEELQRLIAKQDIEIEQMTQEITELKSELDRLQKVLVDEQQSRNQQFEREKHNTDR